MINHGKQNILGVLVDAVDYDAALAKIVSAAKLRQPYAVTALAVHGVMTGYQDDEHRTRLNNLDLVVPDGQPVRWALNLLHRTGLKDRVYGPTLMKKTCEIAEQQGLGIYLFGSSPIILENLQKSLSDEFPKLRICGAEPSKFRRLSADEKAALVDRIDSSGAQITLVGLGCPRQEVWAYENRDGLSMPILAVGAAFAFHSAAISQAPRWMQDHGLEWLFRLCIEPRRLWRRYLLLNPLYLGLVTAQMLRLRRFSVRHSDGVTELSYG